MRRPFTTGRIVLGIMVALLISGVLLALAQDTDTNPPPPLTGTITYTVRSNDVLDVIAARYDVATQCLVTENNLAHPGRLFVGDTLTISADCPFYSGSMPVLNPRAGHTLGATAEALTTVNGQQTYTVQMNDTLDTIAQKLNVSLQALKAANGNPKPTTLKVGTALIVPVGAPAYGVYLPVNPSSEQGGGAAPNERIYIVQPGDVLDLIAASFNIQLSCLVARNNHKRPWFVASGESLILPNDCPAYDGQSYAFTPNPNGLQNGSGGGQVIISTPAPTQPPLAQLSPTPEQLQPTLPPATSMPVTVVAPTQMPPTVAAPNSTDQAVG